MMTALAIAVILAFVIFTVGAMTDWDYFGLFRSDSRRYCPECQSVLRTKNVTHTSFGAYVRSDYVKECPKCGRKVTYTETDAA